MTAHPRSGLDTEPPVDGRVLVCFAVPEEARFFSARTRTGTDTLITGMGVSRARVAVEGYLSRHRPALVISSGFAGGLNPIHPLGRVLGDDTHAGRFQGHLLRCDIPAGRFVHSDRVLVTAAEKARLFESSGADAVEMESSGIVAVCCSAGVPVLVLRVISDIAGEDLPMDFNRFARPDGSLSLGRLLAGLARSPRTVPGLMRFQTRLRQASGELARALERLLSADTLLRGRDL